MRRNPVTTKTPADQAVKDNPRATCKLHPSEQMIRIVWSDDRAPTGAVVCGTNLAQAATSRPWSTALPLPIAAAIAAEIVGPTRSVQTREIVCRRKVDLVWPRPLL